MRSQISPSWAAGLRSLRSLLYCHLWSYVLGHSHFWKNHHLLVLSLVEQLSRVRTRDPPSLSESFGRTSIARYNKHCIPLREPRLTPRHAQSSLNTDFQRRVSSCIIHQHQSQGFSLGDFEGSLPLQTFSSNASPYFGFKWTPGSCACLHCLDSSDSSSSSPTTNSSAAPSLGSMTAASSVGS